MTMVRPASQQRDMGLIYARFFVLVKSEMGCVVALVVCVGVKRTSSLTGKERRGRKPHQDRELEETCKILNPARAPGLDSQRLAQL